MSSANSLNLVRLKNLLFATELTLYQTTNYLEMTKLKTFADDILNIAKMTISLCHRVEIIVEKGENAGHQHFLLFPQIFPKLLL